MTPEERAKEVKQLEQLTKRLLAEIRAGENSKAKATALTLHYGADLLWREN